MAISEAETSKAPVLLKESDIPEASLAVRKPAELGEANLLFWLLLKRDRESTVLYIVILGQHNLDILPKSLFLTRNLTVLC